MPTMLISDNCTDVISALASPPSFTQPQVLDLYGWVSRLITALFNYVSFFLGNNAEQTIFLESRVQDLEEKLDELQSKPTVPPTIPYPTPQQLLGDGLCWVYNPPICLYGKLSTFGLHLFYSV